MKPIVIVGCSGRKRLYPCRAQDMYTGQHFALAWAAARALAPFECRFILSARYGLLAAADVIAPYDLTLGQPGAVTSGQLAGQAAARGLAGGLAVIALCSARYATLIGEVWPDATTPLAHLGIGRQRAVLAQIRDTGTIGPRACGIS